MFFITRARSHAHKVSAVNRIAGRLNSSSIQAGPFPESDIGAGTIEWRIQYLTRPSSSTKKYQNGEEQSRGTGGGLLGLIGLQNPKAVFYAHLVEYPMDVILDGLFGKIQLAGDLFVR